MTFGERNETLLKSNEEIMWVAYFSKLLKTLVMATCHHIQNNNA